MSYIKSFPTTPIRIELISVTWIRWDQVCVSLFTCFQCFINDSYGRNVFLQFGIRDPCDTLHRQDYGTKGEPDQELGSSVFDR